ncbi:hypothetical protein HaLaN_28097, partial [Haematococcus lacustris]
MLAAPPRASPTGPRVVCWTTVARTSALAARSRTGGASPPCWDQPGLPCSGGRRCRAGATRCSQRLWRQASWPQPPTPPGRWPWRCWLWRCACGTGRCRAA